MRRRSLLFNSVVYIVGQLATKILGFVLLVVYARFLEPADFGVTGTLNAYSAVLGAVLVLGLQGAVARHYFELKHDPAELRSYLSSVYGFQLGFAAAIALALELAGPALWHSFTSGHIPFSYARLTLWTTFFTALTQIPLTLLQTEERATALVVWQTLQGILLVALGVVFVALLDQHALGVVRSQVVMATIYGSCLVIVFARNWASRRLRAAHIRRALHFGLPLLPHALGTIMMMTVDRIMLEKYATQSEVGLYSIAMTLAMITAMVAGAINQAWAPHFLRTHAEEAPADARKKAEVFASLFVALFTGLALVAALLGPELVLILGAKYRPVVRYMVPLVIGNLISIYAYLPANQLLMASRTRYFTIATTIATSVSVGSLAWYMPRGGGPMTAAWIFVIATSVQSAIILLAARSHQRSLLGIRHAIAIAVGLVALGAATQPLLLQARVALLAAATLVLYVTLVAGNWREMLPPRPPQRA